MHPFSGSKGLEARGDHENVSFIVFEKGNNVTIISVLSENNCVII